MTENHENGTLGFVMSIAPLLALSLSVMHSVMQFFLKGVQLGLSEVLIAWHREWTTDKSCAQANMMIWAENLEKLKKFFG